MFRGKPPGRLAVTGFDDRHARDQLGQQVTKGLTDQGVIVGNKYFHCSPRNTSDFFLY